MRKTKTTRASKTKPESMYDLDVQLKKRQLATMDKLTEIVEKYLAPKQEEGTLLIPDPLPDMPSLDFPPEFIANMNRENEIVKIAQRARALRALLDAAVSATSLGETSVAAYCTEKARFIVDAPAPVMKTPDAPELS